MREKGNFHAVLFKIKHVEIINFIPKTLRIKADFFWSQLYNVIDLKETREFIQNCTLLTLKNTLRGEVITFRIRLLYRVTRTIDPFSFSVPQNHPLKIQPCDVKFYHSSRSLFCFNFAR